MSACNRLVQLSFLLFVLLVGVNPTWSQGRVSAYRVETYNGAFNSISGTGSGWYNWDCWRQSTGITLPFTFQFDGSSISSGSTVYATSSGALALKSTFPSYGQNSGQGVATYPALLSFMGGSLSTGDNHNGDYLQYYQTLGSAPNRIFVVEFRNIHFVCAANGSGRGPSSYATHVQVRLYEATGVIEYDYSNNGRSMGTNCFTNPSIGINGLTTPSFASKTVSTNVSSVPTDDIRFVPPPPPAQLSVQPKLLAFGSVTNGSPVTLCTTIKSVGSNPLTITGTTISGTSDYQVVSGPAPGTILQPGTQTTVCVRFNPLASGSRTGILTVTSDGADSGSQQVNLTGVGIAPGISVPITEYFRKTKITVGDSVDATVMFQSIGTGPLMINNVQITGGAADQYAVKRIPTYPIPVGQWDSILITFKPTFEGRHDATFLINNSSLNAPQVSLRAVGIAIMPRLVISPMRLDFDSVYLGETSCKDVTLYNPGTDTVNILRVIRTFSDKDFTFTPLASTDTVILPEQTKVYRICFTPTNIGTRLATVRFYSDIGRTIPDGRDTSQFILDIIGVGVPYGSLSLSGTVTDSAVIGFENCVTDVIRNIGTAPVTITSATISGVDASEYRLTGLTLPVTLNAGETRPVTICLTPTVRGPRTADLVLNGSSEGQLLTSTLPLNGVGLAVCAVSDRTSAFNETMTPVGTSDTVTITVTNCGDVATSYEIRPNWIVGPYIMFGPINTPVIAPGGTTSFDVYFTPTEIGAASAAITIRGSGIGVDPITIDLGGVGSGVVASATGGAAGDVKANDCSDFTVTITNNGNVDWTPGTPSITGPNASEFTFVSLNPETIPAGSTGTLTLRYCPTAIGNSTATLNFPNASPAPLGNFTYSLSGRGTSGAGVNTATASRGVVLGQNHPNPSMTTASFTIVIPRESLVRIDLFDQTGALVRNIMSERISGERTIDVDVTTLASGTYNYVLTNEEVRLVRQLTVVH